MENKNKLLRTVIVFIGFSTFSFRTTYNLKTSESNNSSPYYGEFRIKKTISYESPNSQPTFFMAIANIYEEAVNYSQLWTSVNNGIVFFNDSPLKYKESIQSYLDTVIRKTNEGVNWKYNNQNNIDFNITLSDTFPSLTNLENLPSELIKSNDLTIDLSGYSYADVIEIDFYDGITRLQRPYYRKIQAGQSSITIPSSDLSVLSSNGLRLTVGLIKQEYRDVNGKTFMFEKRLDVVRYLPVSN